MDSTEIMDNTGNAEDLDNMEPGEDMEKIDPGDAIRYHIGKVLEAIESSTASQKQNGKPPAPPPRMLQMHLPSDARQVLVFVIAGNANPTVAASADLERTDISDKDARVRIVEQQGEDSTSTVLVVDEWGGTKSCDNGMGRPEDTDERQETVVINIAGQTGNEVETESMSGSESDEEVLDEDSDGNWAPAEVDSNDEEWVPKAGSKTGRRALGKATRKRAITKKALESPTHEEPSPKKARITTAPVTCDKCGIKFASGSAFNFHPCEKSTDESHFVCRFCGEEYNDQNVFWDHYRGHVGMKRIQSNKCTDCLKVFSTPELLQEHCAETNHTSHVQCTICEEKFESHNQLCRHKRVVHHLNQVCQKCKEPFATREELAEHRLVSHSITHKCRVCAETFSNRNLLLTHMRDTHTQETHSCVFCERIFLKKSTMLAHQAQHLGSTDADLKVETRSDAEQEEGDEDAADSDGKTYVCEKCGHAFSNLFAFQKHSITHSERVYPCNKCSIVMRTEEDLLRHQHQRHEVKLICDQCGRQYPTMRDLRKHLATHSETRPFPCATCGFRFFTEDRLKKHLRIHQAKRFLCNLCPMKFTDKEHLRRHLKAHASTNRQRINACVFHCLMCPETFDSPTRLIQHYDTSHPLAEFRCVECDTRVTSFNLMKIHFRGEHRGKVIHCCRVCGDAFDNKATLETHRSNDHNVPRRQQIIANTKVTCSACNITFNSYKLYQDHLPNNEVCREAAASNKEPDPTPFKCAICGEEFPTNSHLVTHNSGHGDKFPVSCHICGAELVDATQVTDHLNQHIAIGVWSCLKCNRNLSTRQSLRMHMAGHGTVAPFTCTTCNKKFNWRSALAWHMNVHTGEQPFRCKRCDASFKQPNQLKAHLLAHDGRKMYECSECSKTFWLRSALLSHLTNHTIENAGESQPAPTYNCNICGKIFNAKSYLSNHLRTHKGEKGLIKKHFACERCKRTFTTRAHLIIHERTHDGAGLVCPVCQRKFKTLNWLQIHMRIHTSESPVCPICNKSFTIQRSLEEHMAFHDEQNVEVTCPTCNTKFRSERAFLRHKGKCREGFDGQVCRVCGLGFTTAEKYNEHAQVCDIKQNRRTTENIESTVTIVKTEQSVEEDMVSQEPQVVFVTTDEPLSVVEEVPNVSNVMADAPDALFVPDDNGQMIIQNVLEAIEGEKYVVSNTDGNADLDQLIEGQMPTELILDGPQGKVRVQLVFQTMG